MIVSVLISSKPSALKGFKVSLQALSKDDLMMFSISSRGTWCSASIWFIASSKFLTLNEPSNCCETLAFFFLGMAFFDPPII